MALLCEFIIILCYYFFLAFNYADLFFENDFLLKWKLLFSSESLPLRLKSPDLKHTCTNNDSYGTVAKIQIIGMLTRKGMAEYIIYSSSDGTLCG